GGELLLGAGRKLANPEVMAANERTPPSVRRQDHGRIDWCRSAGGGGRLALQAPGADLKDEPIGLDRGERERPRGEGRVGGARQRDGELLVIEEWRPGPLGDIDEDELAATRDRRAIPKPIAVEPSGRRDEPGHETIRGGSERPLGPGVIGGGQGGRCLCR